MESRMESKAQKYRKKPVVIEAMRFADKAKSIEAISEWMDIETTRISYADPENPHFIIETLEGEMKAQVGDWIIRGIKGEYYRCKPDIFAATYEPVTDGD